MSDHTASDLVDEAAPGPTAPRSSSATVVRITALLFVLAVIGGECLLATLFLPAGSESPAAAASTSPLDHPEANTGHSEKDKKDGEGKKEKKDKHAGHSKEGSSKDPHSKGGHSKETQKSEEEAVDPSGQVEIDLEQFSVTAHLASSNTTMRIEFHLYGVADGSDKAEFEKLVKSNQHRLRDQVLVIVRSAQPRDLADPGLGLIKRQILEKTNALLGKPLLRAVIVSDFSYMEQ
jgi:hypothetical protein